jgi:hypothetical protein
MRHLHEAGIYQAPLLRDCKGKERLLVGKRPFPRFAKRLFVENCPYGVVIVHRHGTHRRRSGDRSACG